MSVMEKYREVYEGWWWLTDVAQIHTYTFTVKELYVINVMCAHRECIHHIYGLFVD